MKGQDKANNKGYGLVMGLAVFMSGLVLGIYVFNNLVIGIGLGFIYWHNRKYWISSKYLKKSK